jgi:hypothetical protein
MDYSTGGKAIGAAIGAGIIIGMMAAVRAIARRYYGRSLSPKGTVGFALLALLVLWLVAVGVIFLLEAIVR